LIPGIKYVQDSESNHYKHTLDVYTPNKKHPGRENVVLLFVHGGGWKRGDKNWWFGMNANVGKHFSENGITVACMSYRLATMPLPSLIFFGLCWGLIYSIVCSGILLFLDTVIRNSLKFFADTSSFYSLSESLLNLFDLCLFQYLHYFVSS